MISDVILEVLNKDVDADIKEKAIREICAMEKDPPESWSVDDKHNDIFDFFDWTDSGNIDMWSFLSTSDNTEEAK